MRSIENRAVRMSGEPGWDFYLPDDEFLPDETFPEPGDFWIEPRCDE